MAFVTQRRSLIPLPVLSSLEGWPVCSVTVAYFAPAGRPLCSGTPAVLLRNMHETSNVWRIDPVSDKVHSAVFPLELCVKVIEFYSYVGDLVFDPFAGSGTFGKARTGQDRQVHRHRGPLKATRPDYYGGEREEPDKVAPQDWVTLNL